MQNSPTALTIESPIAAAPAMDRQQLMRLLEDFGGDTASVAELLHEYLADSAGLIKALEQAISDNHSAAIVMASHTLKGTSASVGASSLATLCADLNRLARGGSKSELPTYVARISAEFQRVRAQLAALQSGPDHKIDVAALLGHSG